MQANGADKPEPQVGEKRQNGLINCGCPETTEMWFLTNVMLEGLTIIQCSVCKRNIGWAQARKREPAILVPRGRM